MGSNRPGVRGSRGPAPRLGESSLQDRHRHTAGGAEEVALGGEKW